jgi:putative transposase
MPWKTTTPMTERLSFIELYQTRLWSTTELCTRFNISRKTGYKWLRRHAQEGLAGLQEKSRAPVIRKNQGHDTYLLRLALIERPARNRAP